MNPSEELTELLNRQRAALLPEKPAQVRIIEIDYVCALCGRRHTAEAFFTANVPDLDTLHAAAMKMLADPQYMLATLKGAAMVHHNDAGNLKKLQKANRERDDVPEFRVLEVVLTPETGFRCDECNREFNSLAERWLHMGRHPRNGHRVGQYVCDVH